MTGVPGFNASKSIYKTTESYPMGEAVGNVTDSAKVVPQLCVSSPCLTLGGGRFCVNLPIVGRQCVNIPTFGRWKARCCTRFGWPPVSCGISNC